MRVKFSLTVGIALLCAWLGSSNAAVAPEPAPLPCIPLLEALTDNSLVNFARLISEAEADDTANITTLLDMTIELPEVEKLTFFTPKDIGWTDELLQTTEPFQVLQMHYIDRYYPLAYIDLALTNPEPELDDSGYVLDTAAGTEIILEENKRGTLYATAEGMSEASIVSSREVETCIGVMHVVSTPLVPDPQRDDPREPSADRAQREWNDENTARTDDEAEFHAVLSDGGDTVPGVSVAPGVEGGTQDKKKGSDLSGVAMWGIVGAFVLGAFVVVASLFALHRRRRLVEEDEFDVMWKNAVNNKDISVVMNGYRKKSGARNTPVDTKAHTFAFSSELLPALPMEAVHPNATLSTSPMATEVPGANSQPVQAPAMHEHHAHSTSPESRYLAMAIDSSGNLRETSSGVGAYRCNAWEYGGAGPQRLTSGSLAAMSCMHAERSTSMRSASSLPTCTIAADSGPLDPRRRGGGYNHACARPQANVAGGGHRRLASGDCWHSQELLHEESGYLGPEDSAVCPQELKTPSRSVSLEFEGTERLREFDAGDTKGGGLTAGTEAHTEKEEGNSIDLSQSFKAAQKRARNTRELRPPSHRLLPDADFVHLSPTHDLLPPPVATSKEHAMQAEAPLDTLSTHRHADLSVSTQPMHHDDDSLEDEEAAIGIPDRSASTKLQLILSSSLERRTSVSSAELVACSPSDEQKLPCGGRINSGISLTTPLEGFSTQQCAEQQASACDSSSTFNTAESEILVSSPRQSSSSATASVSQKDV